MPRDLENVFIVMAVCYIGLLFQLTSLLATLVGLKNVVRYTMDFKGFVLGFRCLPVNRVAP